jgi:hypothetical protein
MFGSWSKKYTAENKQTGKSKTRKKTSTNIYRTYPHPVTLPTRAAAVKRLLLIFTIRSTREGTCKPVGIVVLLQQRNSITTTLVPNTKNCHDSTVLNLFFGSLVRFRMARAKDYPRQ